MMIRRQIGQNIAYNQIIDSSKKINQLSVNFITNLKEEDVTLNSMLIYILSDSCKKYSNNLLLTTKLYDLYGASLEVSIDIIGTYHIMEMRLSFIDNKFSIDNENIALNCFELMEEIITNPNLISGLFPSDTVEFAKGFLNDLIQSEYYDERNILIRCTQDMFGVYMPETCYGNSKDIGAITPLSLANAFEQLLSNSIIEIFFLGTKATFPSRFSINRGIDKFNKIHYQPYGVKIRDVNGIQKYDKHVPLETSKLILSFGIDGKCDPYAMWLFSIIFGEAPFSRLCLSLRKNLGICYECYMQYDPFLNGLFFYCNIESKNQKKAQSEVIRALNNLKLNGITDEELKYAKNYAINRLLSFNKGNNEIKRWGLLQILCNQNETPTNRIVLVNNAEKEQINRVAHFIIFKGTHFLDNQ